jgi:MFS family permease
MLRINLAVFAAIGAVVAVLVFLTGDAAQWIGYGIGIYAVFSWTQTLRFTDPPAYWVIWGNPAVRLAVLAFGSLSFFTYAYSFWVAPFAMRSLEVSKQIVGIDIGIPGAIASAAGVVIGGHLSDRWKKSDPRGRVFVCMLAVVTSAPLALWMFGIAGYRTFCWLSPCVYLLNSMWVGSAVAAYQDLVLPRMRGTIGATYLLGATMLGLALGPYFVGKVATVTGSLQDGLYCLLAEAPLTLALLWIFSRKTALAEATKFTRAWSFGEPKDEPSG